MTKFWKVPEKSFLVTMDVNALYINIPNNEGIATVKRKHDKYTKKTVATIGKTKFLALILKLKNFVFNSELYLKIKGCTIEVICAPYIRKHITKHMQTCSSLKRDTYIL